MFVCFVIARVEKSFKSDDDIVVPRVESQPTASWGGSWCDVMWNERKVDFVQKYQIAWKFESSKFESSKFKARRSLFEVSSSKVEVQSSADQSFKLKASSSKLFSISISYENFSIQKVWTAKHNVTEHTNLPQQQPPTDITQTHFKHVWCEYARDVKEHRAVMQYFSVRWTQSTPGKKAR